jgi:hypothetical protein
MPYYQIAWNPTTVTAVVQSYGDILPAGSTVLGQFQHDEAGDDIGPAENHVYYHHVRDVLYHEGIYDMSLVTILKDDDYINLMGISIAPETVSIEVGATQQLTIVADPEDATNQEVIWASGNPAVATVSSGGLVTGVSAGTATITATSIITNMIMTSRVVTVTNP